MEWNILQFILLQNEVILNQLYTTGVLINEVAVKLNDIRIERALNCTTAEEVHTPFLQTFFAVAFSLPKKVPVRFSCPKEGAASTECMAVAEPAWNNDVFYLKTCGQPSK